MCQNNPDQNRACQPPCILHVFFQYLIVGNQFERLQTFPSEILKQELI